MKNQSDLTKGNIGKQLWSLAWPMMLSFFFYTLYNIIDAYWVSKISADAIAAVSISQISLFLMMSIGFGITVGSGVIMAMDIGAKNKKEAGRVLGQSFVLTTIAGLFFTILALLFREQLLTVSGAYGDIFKPAEQYFTVIAGGSIFSFILITIMFAFNSQGDTFTLTKLFAVSTFVNLVLDPLFIFGWKIIPEMGIAGAAVATLISQGVFIIIALYTLSRPSREVPFHFRNLSFNWESVKQVLDIGIPAALTQVLNPIGLAVLTLIASTKFLEPGAIAFSLGFRIEFFAYLPAVGYGFGAMAMMGQSIGNRNMERAQRVFHKGLKYATGIAFVMGILAAIFASQIITVFTTEAVVKEYTLSYFRIVALSYAFLAATMVEASAFQAMGKSWPGFWILFLRFIVLSIPLSYIFTFIFNFSITSIWISLVIGNIIASIAGYFWIRHTMKIFDFKEVKEAVQTHS